MESLRKKYGAFGWRMVAGNMEEFLVVGGFDVDGGVEARLVNQDVNIQEGEMVQVNRTG